MPIGDSNTSTIELRSVKVRFSQHALRDLLSRVFGGSDSTTRETALQILSDVSAELRASFPRNASRRPRNLDRFPQRAAWLRVQMIKRGFLTATGIEVLGGPNHHTVQKVLRGEDVRDSVLERLAAALTAALPTEPIEFTDIPGR
jgi:hypothetical protein